MFPALARNKPVAVQPWEGVRKPMKIAIDLTALLSAATGAETFMRNLVLRLGAIDRENLYRIYLNFEDCKKFVGLLPSNFTLVPRCCRMRLVRLVFQQIWFPLAVGRWKADVVHSPSFLVPFYRGKQRHLVTVHDMTFFSLPAFHNRLHRSWLFRRMVHMSILGADRVQVPSATTKRDVLRQVPQLSGESVRVIPHGCSNEFRPRPKTDVSKAIDRLGLPRAYILYVGTIEPRKNLSRLIDSYRKLVQMGRSEHLVLAGRLGWGYRRFLKKIERFGLADKIHLLGYVPQTDLPWVYAGARLFVFPSLYEGFGLPPLEAMGCGIPTIAARSASLAEYYHEAALLFTPSDVNALAVAMNRMLSDKSLRAAYRNRGIELAYKLSWTRTARKMLECYQALMQANPEQRNANR